MSLLKIPFLISITWGIHRTMTPPQPPPRADERVKTAGFDLLLPGVLPVTTKLFFWIFGVFEILILVANATTAFPLSQQIILTLAGYHGEQNSIAITLPFVIGWGMNSVGALIRISCYRALGRMFTFELSIRKDHALVTHGPYSFVRHPSYTGVIIAGIGTVICHTCRGSWIRECTGVIPESSLVQAIIFISGTTIGIMALKSRLAKEDIVLKEHFGKEWEEWAHRVPSKIIPGVY